MPTSGRLSARPAASLRAVFPLRAAGVPRAGRDGFTLLEILVAIALIALLSAVLIGGATRMLSSEPTLPADVFRKAVADARQQAVEKEVEVRLSFDSKEKAFQMTSAAGSHSYPLTASGDVSVDFLSNQKGGSAILVGGVLIETQTLPFVTFYPDGTCSPFRVQFHLNGDVPAPIAIDPWTCAPVLPAPKEGSS